MELIKSLVAVAADPLSYILVFILLSWRFRILRKYWLLVVLYLVLMATPIVHMGIAGLWAVPDKVDARVKYDAAVLLLGVTDYGWHLDYTPNGRMGYCNLNQNANRVGYVLRLFQEGRISRLLLGKNMIGEFDETACVIDLLQQQGIDKDRIIVIGVVKHTSDEIHAIKPFIDRSDFERVIMVTSSNHMRRALALVQVEGLTVDHYATSRTTIKGRIKEFIPGSKWLVKNRALFYEILVYFGYKLSGKL